MGQPGLLAQLPQRLGQLPAPTADPAGPDSDISQSFTVLAEEAPRFFALVQELGERVDGRVAAWGMAFDDSTEVVGAEPGTHLTLRSPESAVLWFSRDEHVQARLVWL